MINEIDMNTAKVALDEKGDILAPPGTKDWAEAYKLRLRTTYKNKKDYENQLNRFKEIFFKFNGWQSLCDKNGQSFLSWEAFCSAKWPYGLGVDPKAFQDEEERRRTLRPRPGPPPKEERNVCITNIKTSENTGSSYYLARLERDENPLAEKVKAGELSANAAAIEAGFRKRTVSISADDPERARRTIIKNCGEKFAVELARRIFRDGGEASR